MEPSASSPPNYDRWLAILAIIVFFVGAALIALAFQAHETTGTLKISSTDAHAKLSISQTQSEAKNVGSGSAKIRLKPGTYVIAASYAGSQSYRSVRISKKQTSSVTLDPAKTSYLPSLSAVNFNGLYALVNNGLSSQQTNALKYAFFKFNPNAKTISAITNTVYPGPHDLVSGNFTIKFGVVIDSAPYNAVVGYSGLNNARLTLYNTANNSVVFDSGQLVSQ